MGWDINFKDIEFRESSQNAEDGVIEALCNLVRPAERFFVELGADMSGGSLECNTLYLHKTKRWRGYIFDQFQLDYPICRQAFVTAENFNELLKTYEVPFSLGLLSIDVDGNDYWLWKALIPVYRPDIVCIEYNPTIDPIKRLVIPYDPAFKWHVSDYFGASAGALVALAHQKGYRLITDTNHVNLFFVREELVPSNWIEPSLASLGGALGRSYPTDNRPYQEV